RFIANRVSFKMKFERINKLVEELKVLVESRQAK
ncbi:MAG TPA: ATP phosphoribosyltransferase, partial [Negativicutes bacterium]